VVTWVIARPATACRRRQGSERVARHRYRHDAVDIPGLGRTAAAVPADGPIRRGPPGSGTVRTARWRVVGSRSDVGGERSRAAPPWVWCRW
jgi:hypothetical protein